MYVHSIYDEVALRLLGKTTVIQKVVLGEMHVHMEKN